MAKFICNVLLEYKSEVEAETGEEAATALRYQMQKQPYAWKLLSIEREGLPTDHKCPECEAQKEELRVPKTAPDKPPGGRPNGGGSPGTPIPAELAA